MNGLRMPPGLRRASLLLHIIVSVGWLGAVVAYLPLAFTGLTSSDAEGVRGAYFAMERIGWSAIVPLCVASLLTGVVQSLGTEWGLFRHYWVVAKLGLTLVASAILLAHLPTVSRAAAMAAARTLPLGGHDVLRTQLVVHAAGGLVVLIALTALSVFKPWGRIRAGGA